MRKKIIILTSIAVCAALLSYSFTILKPQKLVTKEPHLAGSWYPREQATLQQAVENATTIAKENYKANVKSGTVRAIISPHAGIRYSGAVAASVYALTPNNIKKVIILAPDHSGKTKGVAFPSFDSFSFPTGSLPVDTSIVNQLKNVRNFHQEDNIFSTEHSLEMQLPFIDYFLKNVLIVPLIVGAISCTEAHDIAKTLAKFIDNQTLVAVTSDFIHYGARFSFTPVSIHQQIFIRHMDSRLIQLIEQGDCESFAKYVNETGATICGSNPIKILLQLLTQKAFGNVEPRLIAYDRSGKTDLEDSVSYVGMLFTSQKLDSLPVQDQLTQQEKKNLYTQATDVFSYMFDPEMDLRLSYPILSFGATRPRGVFTTLYTQDDKLRGCIGSIQSNDPTYLNIVESTKNAAFHDSRFSPVTKEEAPSLKLKLSILSPLRPTNSYKNIKIGTHGIVLKKDGKSAVFLPEVPIDFNWNLEQTLTQLAEKAGLDSNAWQDPDTQFEIFESIDIEKAE